MIRLIAAVAIAGLLIGCSQSEPGHSFQVKMPGDPEMRAQTEAALPKVLQACPGLNKYARDLSEATVERSELRDYEGGIQILFTVSDKPRHLPAPLNTQAMKQHCGIFVKKDGSMMYIPKTGCHSICDGKLQFNDPGLMGREIALK